LRRLGWLRRGWSALGLAGRGSINRTDRKTELAGLLLLQSLRWRKSVLDSASLVLERIPNKLPI
jgi:hypothetical protein